MVPATDASRLSRCKPSCARTSISLSGWWLNSESAFSVSRRMGGRVWRAACTGGGSMRQDGFWRGLMEKMATAFNAWGRREGSVGGGIGVLRGVLAATNDDVDAGRPDIHGRIRYEAD